MKVKDIVVEYEKVPGMPPSYRNDYGPIANGYVLEVHVVNHCNLNCAGCNHFAPLADPWYIDVNVYQDYLNIIKQRVPQVKRILLLGGEPFLHPQLGDLVKITRLTLPDVHIQILTNGILIPAVSNEVKQKIRDYKAALAITTYPTHKYEHIFNELDKTDIRYTLQSARLIFQQTLVDETGSQDPDHLLKCTRSKNPCLTLKDYKLYICPFCAYMDCYCSKFKPELLQEIEQTEQEGIDYLDIHTITTEKLQEFCSTPKQKCKYCSCGGTWIWHLSKRDKDEYTKTLKDLYLTDYPRYDKIINNNQIVEYFYSNPDFWNRIDETFGSGLFPFLKKRFFESKIDIIIPYYKMTRELILSLKSTLERQTIISDCVIYLISDNSPQYQQVYEIFSASPHLNCVFLRNLINQGPGVARNLGLKNSYGEYVFFLDSDDVLTTERSLEILYEKAEENKCDILSTYMVNDAGNKHLFKNSFLKENQIEFFPFYINEDGLFFHNCNFYKPIVKVINNEIYRYMRDASQDSIGHTTSQYVKCVCAALNIYPFIKKFAYFGIHHTIAHIAVNTMLKDNFLDCCKTQKQQQFLFKTLAWVFQKCNQLISIETLISQYKQQGNYENSFLIQSSFFDYFKNIPSFISNEEFLNELKDVIDINDCDLNLKAILAILNYN